MISHLVGTPVPAGTLRSSLYLCQLPDFGAWAEGAAISSEELVGLGACQIHYGALVRVPADSTVDLHNFLDQYRRGALVRPSAPSNSLPDELLPELRQAG